MKISRQIGWPVTLVVVVVWVCCHSLPMHRDQPLSRVQMILNLDTDKSSMSCPCDVIYGQ